MSILGNIHYRRGITLIEILVVMVILSVLALFLMPFLSNARIAADHAVCLGNLRVVHNGAIQYISDKNGTLPDLVYWRQDDERYQKFSIVPYIYGEVTKGTVGMKTSVFSCPITHKDPLFRPDVQSDRMNATYGLNLLMHGTNEDGGSVSNYDTWKTRNPVAWNMANIQRPEEAPLFMDGASMSGTSGVYYSVYQSFARIGMIPKDGPGGNATPFLHPGERVNVIFVDGRVDSLTREEMLLLNWSGRWR